MVTDSTAYLPPEVAAEQAVTVVPLQVSLGDRALLEGVDLSPAEFARWISRPGRRATTSQPTPAAFAAAYRGGRAEIVSVHLSGALSGTVAAARVAAEVAAAEGRRVHVVDSRNTGMGLGFSVLAAVEAAARGGLGADVAAAAERAARRTRTLFYVDTLEHLRRGGRIGTASALLGTALSMKPLLHVVDGGIAALEKVRTATRAIARLTEIAVAEAGDGAVDIAVHHLAAGERAEALAERLRERVAGLRRLYRSEVGAVVGAHVGPGLLAVVVHHR